MRFIVFALLLLSLNFNSQNRIDILTIGSEYGLPTNMVASDQHQAQSILYNARLALPIPIDSNNIIYNAINYGNNSLIYDLDLPNQLIDTINLHSIIYQLGYIKKWNDGRELHAFVIPRLMTDWENIGGDHLQLGLMMAYGKKYSDDLKMRFGFLINNEFYGPFANPLIIIDWKINQKWKLDAFIPLRANLIRGYNHDKLEWAIYYTAPIYSYRLGNERYNNAYVQSSNINFGSYVRFKGLSENIHLELGAFYTVTRDFEQYNDDQNLDFRVSLLEFGEEREVLNPQFEKGIGFRARLMYTLPL